jgi:type IV pilus assembly protein PilW
MTARIAIESPDTRTCRQSKCQAGFGLVELMISIVIGLVIIGALVALFLGTSRNNREMSTASSVIENGRFALQLLESDVVHAGFWGTYVASFDDQTLGEDPPGDAPTAVPDPCQAYDPADPLASWPVEYRNNLIGIPLQVYDGDDVCGAVVTDMAADSDLLVVRHADTCVAGDPNCEAEVANRMYFQSALCADEVPAYELGQSGVAAFNFTRRNCADQADLRRFISHLYYVRDYAVDPADGIPTLVRSDFDLDADGDLVHLPAVPLIEGIEALRIELGVDNLSETGGAVDYGAPINWADPDTKTTATNRGDGVPDQDFVRCTDATPCDQDDLANVTAVKIYVLARSREATQGYTDTKIYSLGSAGNVGPFDDGFKRHVYVTTVRLPNIAGRRIRP